MLTYFYRTTNAYGCISDMGEAKTALEVIRHKNDHSGFEHERKMIGIKVEDSGESHEGLTLTIQVYGENCEAAREHFVRKPHTSWLDVCHIHLSDKQGHELIEAISNAFRMRKYDDEMDEDETTLPAFSGREKE